MKKTRILLYRFAPALLFIGCLSSVAVAQKPGKAPSKPDEVNVRIIERDGGKVREIERTYRIDGMTDPERDKLVMKLVDSLKAARKVAGGKRQMTIIVEDNDGDRTITRERVTPRNRRAPGDVYVQRGRLPRSEPNDQTWEYEFRRGADSLADRMSRFRFQFPKDWDQQLVRPFEEWSRNFNGKPSTIRGLDAYPNNPDTDRLNIRFTAPAKGDVSIVVTNPKGKEVARREIKDFSGEFVGQIDLGKKPQGAYFVTVTQNEDGAVRRIVID
ncbi:T9SS type A sorting domain-containing protein [Spirosoma taeanense]|uniref:T9SS type A sorting domain-containing protein n=1 Tax=Spirosoma taeanense TaxID=2735870 RepID=A0A6M5YF13_9BACT|nr:T9SS type A sorting domain-containing protein [Spirosoma taeanense]QJW91896.1 T9SS type A sorting domain-containing protein [Spirosoma taeanense]